MQSAPRHTSKASSLPSSKLSANAFRLFLMAACAFSPITALAQAPVPIPGTTAVGKAADAVSVSVTMTAVGIAVDPVVLTQGISGKDFASVAGGSCADSLYNVGDKCTVNVVFTPLYPGVRNGAVEIVDGTGRLLGETLVTGTAKGSLSALLPGEMSTVAGNNAWIYQGDNVPAIAASIFLPTGVVADAAGNLFIADSSNNRIRRVDKKSGLISTVAGNGNPGFSGDNGPATSAMISTPAGLALDGAGNLYFADTGNHAIRRVDAVTQIITTVAGIGGVQGYSAITGPAVSAKLSLPEGVAFDTANNLYIADTGNDVIRKVDATTGDITTIAGTGAAGYNGDNILAILAELNSPWNLSVAPDGTIYFADLTNNRVRKVSPAGIISTVAGNGVLGFAGDGGDAASSIMNEPASAVLDPAGNIYIADSGNNRVREISVATGKISTIAGTGGEQYVGDGGPANMANVYGPYALFFDQTGNLFLTDMFHNRIREISASPLSLTYAALRSGKISPAQVVSVVNDGNAPLTLAAPTFTYSALDPATTTCNTGTVLALGATCDLGVEFAPTTTGTPVLGSLMVNSDAGDSPSEVDLSGTVLSVNPTSISVKSSLNPSLLGATVTFTATVSSGGAALTGSVSILDGNVVVCAAAVSSSGVASCSTSTLSLGSHTITASYAGDSGDAASVSPSITQVVKQATTTKLVVSPNPAVVAATVTLTATVAAANGTPTGTVTFYDGTTAIGSANMDANGVASFKTTSLTATSHPLTAQYSGDTTNAVDTSNLVTEVVQLGTTMTTLSSSSATASIGTTVTFTATVVSTNGPAPTGSVQFTDGATVLGSNVVDANGMAALPVSTLAPGTHRIVATYSGDASDATSASAGLVETITQIATTTTLTSSVNPAFAGATVTFTANVAMSAGSIADGSITGKVTFTSGTTTLGSVAVDANGNASLPWSTLPVGDDSVVATYAGNTNYASSSSVGLVEHVTQTGTTTALASSNPNALAGKATTFTATVTTGSGKATGTVNFLDNGTNIGQGQLNANGVATLTVSTLAVGTQSIVAVYAGDSNYTTSTSAPVAEVISLGTPTVTLVGPASPVNAGLSVTFTGTITSTGVTPTGALTLVDGTSAIATQNAVPAGSFSFSTAALAVGRHTLTVSYAGDANNATAVSQVFVLVVQQAPTSTSLASSANPQVLGKTVTFTATASSVGPNLTGSIVFEDNGVAIGSVTVDAKGNASLAISTLTFGTHTISAVYGGDANHATSSATSISELIVQAAGATLLSSLNPSVSGQSVTFTMKLAAVGSTIPTGTVTFLDGTTSLGTQPVDGTGAASLQISTLSVSSHTITANYGGDKSFSATSATLTQTVQSASTQVVLTSSANPAVYGTSVTLSAAITSNGGIATGQVTFTDGGTSIGSGLLDATGVASIHVSTLQPGAHQIVATYAGDGRAGASVSSPLALVVKETTVVTLASSANPAQTLASIVLTASVANSGVGVPTGTVTFMDGSTQLGIVTVAANGVATLTVPSLTAGNHSIIASYVGDGNNFSAVSATLVQVVQLRPTTTTLTASSTNANNPLQVTLISVERWTGPGVPTGTVTFMNGTLVMGTAPVDSTGVATLTVDLQAPSVNITATYAGDVSYAGSTSAAVSVSGGQATQFTMVLDPASITLQSKQHSVTTLTINSLNSFADTLQFGCVGLPTAAACTFSTTQMKLTAGATTSVKITIDTGDPLGAGAESASAAEKHSTGVMLCFLPIGLLASLAMFRSRRKSLVGLLLVICAIMATVGMTGCGGLSVNGTPAGTYTFKVTAIGQGSGVSQAQIMTLTVK